MDDHWRNTMKPVRLFMIDGKAGSLIFLFLFYVRVWTFILLILAMIFFWILERLGLSFDAALRAIRCWVLGSWRPGVRTTSLRRWTDYGEEIS